MNIRRLIVFSLLASLALSSCNQKTDTLESAQPHQAHIVPESVINVSANMDMDSVKTALLSQEVGKSIATGSTTQIILGLSGQQDTIGQKIVQNVIPSHQYQCGVQQIKQVTHCHGFLGCVKSVAGGFVTVPLMCTAPQQIQNVATVTHLFSDIPLTTHGNLRFNVTFQGVIWNLSGQTATLTPQLGLTVNADAVTTGFGKNITVKGLLNCDSVLTPTVTADFSLVEEGGHVHPNFDIKKVDLDAKQICTPQALKIASMALLADPIAKSVTSATKQALDAAFKLALSKIADKQEGKIHIDEMLAGYIGDVRQGMRIDDPKDPMEKSIWIRAAIDSLTVTTPRFDLVDGKQVLVVSASAQATPALFYGAQPAPVDLPPLPLHVGTPTGSDFYLAPQASIALLAAKQALQGAIDAYLTKHGHAAGSVTVDLLQSGNDVLFSLKSGSAPAIHLKIKPSIDAALQRVNLASFDVTNDTKAYALVNMSWLFGKEFSDQIKDTLTVPLGDNESGEIASIINFKKKTNYGTLSGHLAALNLQDMWVDDDALKFTIIAKGTSSFVGEIKPPQQQSGASLPASQKPALPPPATARPTLPTDRPTSPVYQHNT